MLSTCAQFRPDRRGHRFKIPSNCKVLGANNTRIAAKSNAENLIGLGRIGPEDHARRSSPEPITETSDACLRRMTADPDFFLDRMARSSWGHAPTSPMATKSPAPPIPCRHNARHASAFGDMADATSERQHRNTNDHPAVPGNAPKQRKEISPESRPGSSFRPGLLQGCWPWSCSAQCRSWYRRIRSVFPKTLVGCLIDSDVGVRAMSVIGQSDSGCAIGAACSLRVSHATFADAKSCAGGAHPSCRSSRWPVINARSCDR